MDYCHVVHKSGGLHQQLVVYHYYKNTFFILFIIGVLQMNYFEINSQI